jgi:hypothetical protein
MARGRKITLHLVEGLPTGIIKAQIGNWAGLVTYAPRTKLNALANDSDIQKPGVYILVGLDPDDASRQIIYIGESENVLERLKQHEKKEENAIFDYVAVSTNKDDNLTKGHIRYLETRLIRIALETKRATLTNGTHPEEPSLPHADRDEMEVFLEHLQLILPLLGLTFALPKIHQNHKSFTPEGEESPIFTLSTKDQQYKQEVTAQARLIGGEFVVFKGSTALMRPIEHRSYQNQQSRLIRDGLLEKRNGVYVFTEDVPFTSPSAAAAIIRGQSTNGREYWKLKNGKKYGEWFDERITREEIKGSAQNTDLE